MNKLINIICPYLICVLIIFSPTNQAFSTTRIICDNFTSTFSPKLEALDIIDTLQKMSFVEKVNSDSLIDALYCLSTRFEDVVILSKSLMFIGEKYFEDSNFEEAKEAFEEIIQMGSELVSPDLMAGAHNYLALIFDMEGKSLTAYKHNLAQLELSTKHDLVFLSRAYLNLGQFHYKNKDYEKAEALYLKGIDAAAAIDIEQVEHGWLRHRLGQIYREQERWEDAHFFIQKAIDFWDKTENKRARCFTLIQYAFLLNSEGETKKALQIIEEIYKVSQENKFWLCHVEVTLTLGKIHYEAGNYPLAIKYLEQSTALSIDKSIPYYFKAGYELLAKAYEATGQMEKANEYYKSYLKEIEKTLEREKKITQEWAKKNQDLLLNKQTLRDLEQKEQFTSKRIALQKKLIFLGIAILLFVSWLAHSYFKANKKVIKHQKQLIQLNEKIQEQSKQLQEANAKISHENNSLELELVKKLLMLSKQEESIQNIDKQLENMETTHEADKLRKLTNNIKNDTTWDELNIQITQANSELFQILSQKFDNLSQNDLRLCAFLKMNMSTKEIAHLTFKNPASVKVARSRLRKKLGLTHSNTTISTFLNRL